MQCAVRHQGFASEQKPSSTEDVDEGSKFPGRSCMGFSSRNHQHPSKLDGQGRAAALAPITQPQGDVKAVLDLAIAGGAEVLYCYIPLLIDGSH